MRIIAISDTHGQRNAIDEITGVLRSCDLVIHCGDYVSDAAYIEKSIDIPVLCVKGNGDIASSAELDMERIIDGHKLYITHGHNYGVKYGISRLLSYAMSIKAEIVIFGHTHIPSIDFNNGIWLINPGTLGGVRGDGRRTYAKITVTDNVINPDIIQL